MLLYNLTRLFLLVLLVAVVVVVGEEEVRADVLNVKIPGNSSKGTCSKNNVTWFSFNVTAPSPGLSGVFVGSETSYQALKNANLSDPSSVHLPSPLVEYSCLSGNVTSCNKTFAMDKKLIAQILCLWLRNDRQEEVDARVELAWSKDAARGNMTIPETNFRDSGASSSSSTMFSLAVVMMAVMVLMMVG